MQQFAQSYGNNLNFKKKIQLTLACFRFQLFVTIEQVLEFSLHSHDFILERFQSHVGQLHFFKDLVEVVLCDFDVLFPQNVEELFLVVAEKQQRIAFVAGPRCSSDSVIKVAQLLRSRILDDQIQQRNVDATSGDIRTK